MLRLMKVHKIVYFKLHSALASLSIVICTQFYTYIQSSSKEGVLRIIQRCFFLISQQKHMLLPLIRTLSMRQF